MENVIPKYRRPIPSIDDPEVKVEHWDEAMNAFEEKDFKKSLIEVINYVNPKLLKGKDTDQDIKIIQMQGSAEIHVHITNEIFSIKAPFLRITEQTNETALLRKVAEVNFSPLKLAQIHKKNKELWFEYEMPIALSQPNKVYDILRNVSVYADDYDDMFIDKYNASFYKEPKHKSLSEHENEQIWIQITDVFEDYKNYTQFLKDKRWEDFQWDILAISLLKISNMPYVHGKLRSDLVKYINVLFDADLDFNLRVDKGVNFMKKLCEQSQEEIMKNVYHAEQFISLRWRGSAQSISNRLEHNLERVEDYENEGSNFNLSYYLQFVLLKLIYDFTLEDKYKNAIEEVLEEVSGLTPTNAAPKLAKVFYALHSGSITTKGIKKAKKGFFSKLFN